MRRRSPSRAPGTTSRWPRPSFSGGSWTATGWLRAGARAIDFRLTYPSNTLWGQTYTSWTRQNKKIWDARYGFYLVHGFDTRALRDGTYLVQVRAT